MKAAVCYETGRPLVVEDLTVSGPGDGEVEVQVGACAICQSDLHYLSGAWPELPFPVVCGHEVAGTVVETGGGVTSLREGDRVIVSLVRDCGQCRYCKAGQSYLCEGTLPIDVEARFHSAKGERVYQGTKTGGFAEQALVHHSQAVAIPDDLPLDQACLLACGVLTGVGGVGINCVQGAAVADAGTIIAIDLEPSKFPLARQCGASHTLNPDDDPIPEAVAELTGGVGPDYVFVAAGSGAAMELGGEILSKLGCMAIAGLPPAGVTARLQPRSLVNKNQTIMGTKMGSGTLSQDIPRLITFHREGRLKLAELIAARLPLPEINHAIETAGHGEAARNMIVFQ